MDKHVCVPEHAQKMLDWLANRGGIAVWRSVNLSNPGASWSTPADVGKPTWEAGGAPERIITDVDDVVVSIDKEVKRFHVGLRRAGTMIKVTDGGSRRIRAAVARAGDGAYHLFDGREAVIMAPESTVPLREWDERLPEDDGRGR